MVVGVVVVVGGVTICPLARPQRVAPVSDVFVCVGGGGGVVQSVL